MAASALARQYHLARKVRKMKSQRETGTPAPSEATESRGLRTATNRPVCIRYCGRDFVASPEMAGIFLRRTQELLDNEDAQLVPLLHRDGIEMLYVARDTPLTVHDVDDAFL